MQNITYRIVLRGDRKSKDGRSPLVLQAFVNGDRVRIGLGVKLAPSEYDPIKIKANIKGDAALTQKVNTLLAKIKAQAEEVIFNALMTDQALTGRGFEEAFSRHAPAGDFLAFMRNEIDAAKEQVAVGTIKAWNSTWNHLRKFSPKIGFADLNLDFVKRFDVYLRRMKFDVNYIAKHHAFLRRYILLANRRGKRIPNPYVEFKVRHAVKERTFLNAAEVQALRNLYESNSLAPHLHRVLRHFLFQVGTSLRYSDLATMTHDNLEGNLLIFTAVKTAKTGKIVKCPLSEMAQQMLRDSESSSRKLFEAYKEPVMNRHLKAIGDLAGFEKKLTTHVGRHTYAYLFIAAGGQVEVLQKIMGHGDIKTTMIYTHIDTGQIRSGVSKIDAFLSTQAVD